MSMSRRRLVDLLHAGFDEFEVLVGALPDTHAAGDALVLVDLDLPAVEVEAELSAEVFASRTAGPAAAAVAAGCFFDRFGGRHRLAVEFPVLAAGVRVAWPETRGIAIRASAAGCDVTALPR